MLPKVVPTKSNATFVSFYQIDPNKNIAYTDLTGRFPVTSASGNKYILVMYHYDTNTIIGHPVKGQSDADILPAYDYLHQYFTSLGFPPTMYVMDNEASAAVKAAISKRGAKYQLAEPKNHCTNAAERAIRTYKNHFIAGICSTDPKFPINQWD